MGRQAARGVRAVARSPRCLAIALAVAACEGPPDAVPADDASIDAPAIDATADATAVDAAAIDDAPADAAEPDAGPDRNPLGIALVDITAAWPASFRGGRTDPDPWGIGSGAAIADVEGDGDLDVVLARCDRPLPEPGGGPTTLLRQLGPDLEWPAFGEDTDFAAAFTGTCAHAAAFGDYDRDGDPDLFVGMNGADRLLRNDGGTFTDVTADAGVAGPDDDLTSGALWADVNADGLLDLHVLANTRTSPPESDPLNANRLYLNRGDGSFEEVAADAGAAGDGSSQAALISDLDGDGALEIYVANDRFAVNGNGAVTSLDPDTWLDPLSFDDRGVPGYVDRGQQYGVDGPRSSMGVAATDLNGDGIDDLYVTDWGPNHLQVWNPVDRHYAHLAQAWGLDLARNFMSYYNVSWAARFVDFDRDGGEELLLVNGSIHDAVNCQAWTQLDLVLRRRDGDNVFDDITASVGWPAWVDCPPSGDPPAGGRGLALGDLDGDGDDDVVVTPYLERYRVYRNDTPAAGRHRVRVAPRGTVSAPTPVGAVLEVQRLDGSFVRRTLYAGGSPGSQSAPVLEAGLDTDTGVLSATLRWPSGYVQRLDQTPGFAIDEELAVAEPEWLALSERTASASDPAPQLTYRPVDAAGAFLDAAGAGREVTAVRSDGEPVVFTDHGDGRYTAPLPHPGVARITVVTLSVDGQTLAVRPAINYR